MGNLNNINRCTQEVFDTIAAGTHATETYDNNSIYEVELDDPIILGAAGSGMHVDSDSKLILDSDVARKIPIKTTMDSIIAVNTKYYLGEQTTVTITMPTTGLSLGDEIYVFFSSGETACTLSCDLTGFDFVPKANKSNKIIFTLVHIADSSITGDEDIWDVEVKEG